MNDNCHGITIHTRSSWNVIRWMNTEPTPSKKKNRWRLWHPSVSNLQLCLLSWWGDQEEPTNLKTCAQSSSSSGRRRSNTSCNLWQPDFLESIVNCQLCKRFDKYHVYTSHNLWQPDSLVSIVKSLKFKNLPASEASLRLALRWKVKLCCWVHTVHIHTHNCTVCKVSCSVVHCTLTAVPTHSKHISKALLFNWEVVDNARYSGSGFKTATL